MVYHLYFLDIDLCALKRSRNRAAETFGALARVPRPEPKQNFLVRPFYISSMIEISLISDRIFSATFMH